MNGLVFNSDDVKTVREAYRTKRKHTYRDGSPTRWHVCIHEAGHAVMASKLGYKPKKVVVHRWNKNGDLGETVIDDRLKTDSKVEATVALVGPLLDAAAGMNEWYQSADIAIVTKNNADYDEVYSIALSTLVSSRNEIIEMARRLYWRGHI